MSLVAVRKAFPYFALALLAVALVYATSFGTLPRADLAFNNATEVKTVDPAKATGEPEGRVIEGLFEGLLRRLPTPDAPPVSNRENTPVAPQPATAEEMQVSEDGRTYTFRIREGAKWSDGTPLTAEDFRWSWMRMLHPDTVSEYAYQLYYVVGARKYNEAKVEVGDPVEVELDDRANPRQAFPRGTIFRGILKEKIEPETDDKAKAKSTVYVVEADGKRRAFAEDVDAAAGHYAGDEKIEAMVFVLPDFEATVGIKVPDERTLVVELNDPTPYFPELTAFYPLYPVNRACVERHGWPDFTKPENLVTNGPFTLEFRRIRDRLRLRKNPHYWDAANVQLETIDAMAVTSDIAALNMYETGQLDWVTNVPPTIVPEIRNRQDFYNATILSTYFYRVNCTRKPFDDKRIRQALNLTIDKQKIAETILQAGEVPATHLVPPGMGDYVSPKGPEFNPQRARELLAEAGFPGGHGLPKVEIMYNTHETHQVIAEVVQADWKRYLGIDVELRSLEWGSYLNAQQNLEYQVCRAGWNGDYLDPITFINMFVTDGENNQTGWSNKRFDELVELSGQENDPKKRLAMLQEAEQIFLDEQPILPIVFYTSKDMVKPYVTGFFPNRLKVHPLHLFKVDQQARSAGRAAAP